MSQPQPDAFERFRAALIEDEATQAALGGVDDWPTFIDRAVGEARRLGIELAAEELRHRQSIDPLGLARHQPPPGAPPSRPVRGWLPLQIVWDETGPVIDWIYVGDRRLEGPFYEDTARRALARPFNALFRFRTALAELGRWADASPSLAPSGLIFHMSRCGSTLVSEMLAVLAANIVLSEPAPIDTVLQADPASIGLLQDIVAAFGQVRGCERRYFIKLECWHALAIPHFRRAFPTTSWVFLYRDPAEVVVSQLLSPGARMAPAGILADLFGANAVPYLWTPDDLARVLGAVCDAALDALPTGGGLAVNYRDLPEALWTKILPHFGIDVPEDERTAMAAAARFDAKTPDAPFARDTEAKQRQIDDRIRAACALHVEAPYRRLEASGQA